MTDATYTTVIDAVFAMNAYKHKTDGSWRLGLGGAFLEDTFQRLDGFEAVPPPLTRPRHSLCEWGEGNVVVGRAARARCLALPLVETPAASGRSCENDADAKAAAMDSSRGDASRGGRWYGSAPACSPHVSLVWTSTTATPPFSTSAMAWRSTPARSAGSVIGPALHAP
jgi:hypothetical protein